MANQKFRTPVGLTTTEIEFTSENDDAILLSSNNGVLSVSSNNETFFVFDPATTTNFALSDANNAIDARVTKDFVESLNIDANNATYLGGVEANNYLQRSDVIQLLTSTLTTTDTEQKELFSFDVNEYSGGTVKIQVTGTSTGNRQIAEYYVTQNTLKIETQKMVEIYTSVIPEATIEFALANTDVIVYVTSASDFERHYALSADLFVSPNVNITTPENAVRDRFTEPVLDRNQEYILTRV